MSRSEDIKYVMKKIYTHLWNMKNTVNEKYL